MSAPSGTGPSPIRSIRPSRSTMSTIRSSPAPGSMTWAPFRRTGVAAASMSNHPESVELPWNVVPAPPLTQYHPAHGGAPCRAIDAPSVYRTVGRIQRRSASDGIPAAPAAPACIREVTMRLTTVLSSAIALAAVALAAPSALVPAASAASVLTIGTAQPGTITNSAGSALAKVMKEKRGVEVRVQPFAGSGPLMALVQQGKLDLAIVNVFEMAQAMNGE